MTSSIMVGVSVDTESRQLSVTWSNGCDITATSKRRYPFIWLRDTCRCISCFHPDALASCRPFDDLDINCCLAKAEVLDEGHGVRLEWTDGHVSEFTGELLRRVEFVNGSENVKLLEPNMHLWGSEFTIPKFSFQQVMSDDRALYDWIKTLWKTGICLLVDAPKCLGQLKSIGKRIAYLRYVHYGKTFQVKISKDPASVAYTPNKLGMHIDSSYLNYLPGISLLHCIVQTTSDGGQNQLADGFRAAEKLRIKHPDYFKLLTTVPVDFYDIGEDTWSFDNRSVHRTIQLDENGRNVAKIVFSNTGRSRMLHHRRMPLEDVDKFYQALRAFYELLYSPDNLVEYKLREGDIVCFNNLRVLHARAAYNTTSGSGRESMERHLEGGYLEWDELLSKARVIQRQLNLLEDDDDDFLAKTFAI